MNETKITPLGDNQVCTFYQMEVGSVGLITGGYFRLYGTNEIERIDMSYVFKATLPDGTPVLKKIKIHNGEIEIESDNSYIPDPNYPPIPIFIISKDYINKL